MAHNTQFEQQAVETAIQQLEQAKRELEEQLKSYQASGDTLVRNMQQYCNGRRYWVE